MHQLVCQYSKCNRAFTHQRKTPQYCSSRCAYDNRIGKPQHPNSGKKRTKKPTIFICQNCDCPFERLIYPSSNSNLKFCSSTCRNKARIKPDIPCPICNTMFKPKRINGAGKPPKQYCSKGCANTAKVGQESPKRTAKEIRDTIANLYPNNGAQYVADLLGLSIPSIRNIANSIGVTLEPEVYRKKVHGAAKRYMKSPSNPNWHGGVSYTEFGENWVEQRRKTLKRDGYTCQSCFNPGRTVHHIKPRRLFEIVEDSNTLSNLITVCNKCHVPIEIGKIPCPIPLAL